MTASTPKYTGAVNPSPRRIQAAGGEPAASLSLPYLAGYAPALRAQAAQWLQQGRADAWLLDKYPQAHTIRTDKGLFDYVDALKQQFLRKAGTVHKVQYDNKIHVVRNALGLHTRRAITQGGRTNARHEIRVAVMFKHAPEAFLRMILVHELAHLREPDHDKPFYQLCTHMEPLYHQYEFELRLYLTWMEHTGQRLWQGQEDKA